MAAKLLTSDELEAFIHAWLQRWGEQRTNKSGLQYWRLDNGDHLVEAFKELIATLKDKNQYEVKDFRQVKVELLHIMRPIEAAKDKKTAERWRSITIGLWNIAIGATFGYDPAQGGEKIERAPATQTDDLIERPMIDDAVIKEGLPPASKPEEEDLLAGLEDHDE